MANHCVDLYDLAAAALASTISASIPIRNFALENQRRRSKISEPILSENGTIQGASPLSQKKIASSSLKGNKNIIESLNTLEKTSSPSPTGVDGSQQQQILDNVRLQNSREKKDGSLVTAADGAAQQIIVDALRTVSTHIRIVGEESYEDERGNASQELIQNKQNHGYKLDLSYEEIYKNSKKEIQSRRKNINDGKEYETIDCSKVSVFIDPLDGTKNFARGRYDAVTILVAIILDNTPMFGVICKPFGDEGKPSIHNSGHLACYGGNLLHGAYIAGGGPCPLTPTVSKTLPKAVISKSRAGGVVGKCILALNDLGLLEKEPVLVDGAGEKSLRLITGSERETLWFFPKPGTSLWDVAALDAMLTSLGGKLTDKTGAPLDYTNRRTRLNACNEDGIVASTDTNIHDTCIRIFQENNWDSED